MPMLSPAELSTWTWIREKIYEYHAGDFFVTFPGTTYVQKAEAGTKMIFVKEPSINDKELVPMDEEAQKWMKTEF